MIQKFFILLVLAVILYLPTLRAPFTFDDEAVIVHNPLLWHLSDGLSGVQDVWNFQRSRFITNLTIALNFQFQQLHTTSYHLINLLIHLLAVGGVWYLTKLILEAKRIKNLKIDLPFYTALLFLVHPLHTESISYIAQRSSALVGMFYVWSVCFYIKGRVSTVASKSMQQFILSALFALLALLSKETALSLPLALILVDHFVLNKKYPKLLWIAMFGAFLLVISFFDFQFKEILFKPVFSQSHKYDYLTLKTYLLTQLQVLIVLGKLIFFPISLNLDYDFPMAKNLFEWTTVCSIVFLGTMLYLGYSLRKTHWYISFGIFWFFVSLLPHILPPRANVIAEHKLYLTLCLLIPAIIYFLYKHIPARFFNLVFYSIVSIFFILTFQRNILWSDPVLIWKDTVAKSPLKARAYLNLGQSYLKKLDYEEALKAYKHAAQLDPLVPQAYMDVSEILYRQHKMKEAFMYADKAIEVEPSSYLPYIQKGVLLARDNKYQDAVEFFSKSLNIKSDQIETYKMRGMAYLLLKQDSEALKDFDVYSSKRPMDTEVIKKKADIYFSKKDYQKALNEYNQLIHLDPLAPYFYNRSVLHEILGQKDLMMEDRQRAKNLGYAS